MGDYPPAGAAARIRAARIRAGLHEQALSEALGITLPAYCDLESYDDEVFTCMSLEQVLTLARLLDTNPLWLIGGDAVAHAITSKVSLLDVINRMREHIIVQGITPEAFSDRVGWDITPALANPERAWHDWNIDWLYDVCAELQIDWMTVFPGQIDK